MNKTKLKLFVWENVLCDYTCGIAFAIAESKEDALSQFNSKFVTDELENIEPEIYELTEKVAYYVMGGA